jgi:predicted DNA-binding transcriptional regulator YafY
MAYSKQNLEIHSYLAGLYRKYGENDYIHFRKAPETKGIQHLEPLIGAIREKKVVRITYLPFYEDKPYYNDVHPYLLKEHGFRWYLVGWNEFKQQIRTYALDRIRSLSENDGIEYREAAFAPSEYFRYTVGVIAPSGAPPLVKLSVQKTQAQYLITQPWHESQNIHSENEESVVFSFRVHPTYEFKAMLLSLGTDAEVLEPAGLRAELRKDLDRMRKKYEDQGREASPEE